MRLALAEGRTGGSGEKNYRSKWQLSIDTKSMDFCVRLGWEVSAPPFTSFNLKQVY